MHRNLPGQGFVHDHEGGGALALARASHPLPSVVVTAAATVLAIGAGNGPGTCALVAFAIVTGQLSVGWSNDRMDVQRDRAVGHEGKPLASGAVSIRTVDAALLVTVVATTVLSLLLGWRAGLLHLAAVALAWAYNYRLKATVLSWLPYAFGFGSLPAVATLALPGHPAPHLWIVGCAALLGTAANFANAMPGLAADPRSDVHGLPDRIGGRASLLVTAALLLAGSALLASEPPHAPTAGTLAGATLAAALVIAGLPLYRNRAQSRQPFFGLLLVVPVQLLTLVFTSHPLH